MKKFFISFLVLLLIVLSGCTGRNTQNNEASVNFEIIRKDRSYKDENSKVLIEHYFDLAQLKGESDSIKVINQNLQKVCDDFFLSLDELEDNAYIAKSMPDEKLYYTAISDVTHNDNGIICIKVVTDWYMGGTYQTKNYGLTYNVKTGSKVTLEELTEKPRKELLEYLIDTTCKWLSRNVNENTYNQVNNVLSKYELEDFTFYIENNEIVLCFLKYAFTPGSAGDLTIPTGIYINLEQ